MRFEDYIVCSQNKLKVQIQDKDYKFIGDNTSMVVKTGMELFIILRTGTTIKGIFENYDNQEDIIYIEGEEIPNSLVIFAGILG